MMLTDSVGQEFRQGTRSLDFLCSIMSKVWALHWKDSTAKGNSIAGYWMHVEAYLLTLEVVTGCQLGTSASAVGGSIYPWPFCVAWLPHSTAASKGGWTSYMASQGSKGEHPKKTRTKLHGLSWLSLQSYAADLGKRPRCHLLMGWVSKTLQAHLKITIVLWRKIEQG